MATERRWLSDWLGTQCKQILSFRFPWEKDRRMKLRNNRNRFDSTLGDLIAAITDVAFEYTDNAKEAYRMTGLVLADILKTGNLSVEVVDPAYRH